MVIIKSHNSPQYLRKEEIPVTLIEVKNPSHYVVKESPCFKKHSEANMFVEVEGAMQKYYHSVEQSFSQLPVKNSIVVVLHKKKFYRAQVRGILSAASGHLIRGYLLDYGWECNVQRDCCYEIHEDFLRHSFQAVDFKLIDVQPISLLVSPHDLSLEYGPVDTWDTSATSYVKDLLKGMNNVYMTVRGVGEEALFGNLYLTFDNNEVKCINDELIQRKFARLKTDCWDNVTNIDSLLPNSKVQRDMKSCPSGKSPPKKSETVTVNNEDAPIDVPQNSMEYLQSNSNLSNEMLKQVGRLTPTIDVGNEHIIGHRAVIAETSERKHAGNTDNGKIPANPFNKLLKYQISIKSPTKREEAEKIDCVKDETITTDPAVSPSTKITRTSLQVSPQSKLEKLIAIHNGKLSPQKSEADVSRGMLSNHSPVSKSSKCEQNSSESQPTNQNEVTQNNSSSTSPSELTDSKCGAVINYLLHKKKLFDCKPNNSASETNIDTKSNSSLESGECAKPNVSYTEPMQAGNDIISTDNLDDKFSDLEDPLEYTLDEYEDALKSAMNEDPLKCALDSKYSDLQLSVSTSPPSSRRSSVNSDSFTEMHPFEKPQDFSSKSLWEKQKVPALCLGDAIPRPMLSTSEASFPPSLEKTLQSLNFGGPSCIQSVVWPAIFRSRCLAAVAPPHSGKTVAYLLPIVANFLSQIIYAGLPPSKGPIVIILCSSWKKVQVAFDLLKLFLGGDKVKIVSFFANGKNKREKLATLLNGCEILISVPNCLAGFFQENLVCLKRLIYFILDDGNNLLTHNITEVKEIMLQLGKSIGLRPQIPQTLQIVLCTERWTKKAASFVSRFMPSPLLLFTSFLEAAVYAQVPLHAHVCSDSEKKNKLLGILEHTRRTVICTISADTAFEIHSFLKCENVRSFLVTEEMQHFISNGVIQDWKSIHSFAAPHCLVVTDSALTHMSISNANYLIHYDVPEMSRLQFGNRFSCIAENFIESTSSSGCVCHILISGDCLRQAPSLLKLIKRSGTEIPEQLKELAVKHAHLEQPTDISLCHYIKAFGSCSTPNCPQRHKIDSFVDQPSVIPSSGDIHALVTHVCDASHFYIRVLKYISPDIEQPSSMSGAYAKIGFQLKKFFSVESNRKDVDDPVVGENYVLKENTLFYRVKVLEIVPATLTKRSRLKLLYRDEGWVQFSESYQLYRYTEPDMFPPPLALEVYLCNVNTPDTCPDWNPQANRFISELIRDREVDGKIVLCLGETVWLHPMAIREKLLFTNEYLNVLTVDKRLKDAEFAIDNKQHLPLLFAACKNKIALPKLIKPPANSEEPVINQLPTSYAFLELNVCEDVYVSSIISPQQFFVQRAKFVDCLDQLLDGISGKIEANALQKCKFLHKGMHCIALFSEDNRYYRAIVKDTISEGEVAQVFFVDFGDSGCASKDSIFELPTDLLQLPFQAIECELDGVSAPHGGWTDQAEEALYHLTRDNNEEMKILQLKAYKKSPCYDGGNHYVVDIWCDDKSFSEHLLKAGLVLPGERSAVPLEFWEDDPKIEEEPKGFAASSNEEELDEEDKDIEALFCLELSRLMLEHHSRNSLSGLDRIVETIENAVNEDQTEESLGRVEEVIEFVPTAANSPLQALQRLLKVTKHKEVERPKPFISWWDEPSRLFVLIHLQDIQVYELDICDNKFTFSTVQSKVDYFCEVEFFAPVLSNEAAHKADALGIQITLKKQDSARWPRLIKENIKCHHIKYNLNHLDDSDSEHSQEREVLAASNDHGEVLPYLSDEESEESSDEEPNNLSWRALSKDKDPYDPLD